MKILEIGYHTIHGKNYRVDRPYGTSGYMLMLVKNPCYIELDGAEHFADSGSIIVFNKKTPQKLKTVRNFFVYDWIHFDLDGDDDFFSSLDIPFDRIINYSDYCFISELIKTLYNEFYCVGTNRMKMIDMLLKTMLMKINENVCTKNEQTTDPHFNELLELRDKIYCNPQIKWNIELLAAEVNMSRSYFQHIYREVFGVSCISDVINCKIDRAKEILSTSPSTISQVASMCGYDNEEHFMRQFKKIVGVTPTVYRKNNRI